MPSRAGRQGAFLTPDQIRISFGDLVPNLGAASGADWFGPLSPMAPLAPPEVAGRQWDFPSGWNLNVAPRVDEAIGFGLLRHLADSYDLLRLIIETRKDQVARMSWSVKPRDETTSNADDPAAAAISAFLARPDGVHGFADWLRLLLEDLFVIDAPALYLHRDMAGRLLALQPLDGATIKPVIDDWGRTPQPFVADGETVWPTAYQQILKGYPAIDYSVRDLIYRPRNIRVNRAYGYGPVEQIIATVDIALRKQVFTLEYYASGNIPDSLIGVPETWTPDQIGNYQRYWDAYIEGDLARRRKAKFVPGGVAKTFIQTKEPELKGDFDEWLARICCFAFSVSPQALVRQMNRASADTQKEIAEEEGLWPVLNWVKSLIDDVIAREFGAPELEFDGQDQQIDPLEQADLLTTYVKAGVLTINEARQQLGRPPLPDSAANKAMALTPTGYAPIGGGGQGDGQADGDQRGIDEGKREFDKANYNRNEPRDAHHQEWADGPSPTTGTMTKKGADYLKLWEGYKLTRYNTDGAKTNTIGCGHKLPQDSTLNRITVEQQEAFFKKDLAAAESSVDRNVKVQLSPTQRDALIMFVFDEGSKNFANSALLTRLNEGDFDGAADQFKFWIYGGSKKDVIPGLVNRRKAEETLFRTGVYKAKAEISEITGVK